MEWWMGLVDDQIVQHIDARVLEERTRGLVGWWDECGRCAGGSPVFRHFGPGEIAWRGLNTIPCERIHAASPMNRTRIVLLILAVCLFDTRLSPRAIAADAVFIRALNLNGPALEIDGRKWEGSDAADVVVNGKLFENQAVALKPTTDPARARMIRSSVWGSKVDVSVGGLPLAECQVVVYVWEDNHTEQFDLLVNDQPVDCFRHAELRPG